MPISPTYPGVYIEEIPSGVRTITGVATSIAAFIGYFARGPVNVPTQVFSLGDFEREFGGLDAQSEGGYAIWQFFLNGGTEAWVVRVTAGTAASSTVSLGTTTDLEVDAINPGVWGDNLRVQVTAMAPAGEPFDLLISEYPAGGGAVPVSQEVFRNLSMDRVEAVINDVNTGSRLIRARRNPLSGTTPPETNGTLSGQHTTALSIPANPDITVTIVRDDGSGGTITLPSTPVTRSLDLEEEVYSLLEVAPALEAAIRATDPTEPALAGATVTIVGDRLLVLAGPGNPGDVLSFTTTDTSDVLLFTNSTDTTARLQEYSLGSGNNGALPGGTELIGDPTSKTGIHALEDVDLFNLLCIPRSAMVSGSSLPLTATQAAAVITMAETYCRQRRAFFLMDTPDNISSPQGIRTWLAANNTLRSDHAALYFPRVQMPDPLNDFKLRSVGASGTIAGLFARTDSDRGVWKAPAGTEANLQNVFKLDTLLTDPENGTLNKIGINCLRTFPIYGTICWGARTLEGADEMGSEYKYVPVRRLALFIEETLFRSLKWVVFEPNDEPLWAQIRLNVGAFMNNLFRQGAFQGQTPRQAYLVKCDRETTTQNDIDRGIVNILVGFAPLKPAEFVFIKLQQLAGEIQT